MQRSENLPHYGGHMGLAALLCMLSLTGCMAFAQKADSLTFIPQYTNGQIEAAKVVQAQATPVRPPAATFIVRFNDEPELEQVCRNFRRDEAGTRAVFQSWAAERPQLQGLRLVRASYSGELILALPVNDAARRSPEDVIAALKTIDSLAYAEIDSLASTYEER
nr:hypothetical protein [Hyphomonas sp. Mor2]